METQIKTQIEQIMKEHEGARRRAIKLGNETGVMPDIKQINIYELKKRIQNIQYTIQTYHMHQQNKHIPLYLVNDIVPLDYTNNGKCMKCDMPTDAKWKTTCYNCWKHQKQGELTMCRKCSARTNSTWKTLCNNCYKNQMK